MFNKNWIGLKIFFFPILENFESISGIILPNKNNKKIIKKRKIYLQKIMKKEKEKKIKKNMGFYYNITI
jgi:hypothetical protein